MRRSRRAGLAAAVLLVLAWGACRIAVTGVPPLVPPGANADAAPFSGLGGDADALEALRRGGDDTRALRDGGLEALRARLDAAAPARASGLLLYRGRLVNNLTQAGVPGFVVCPRASPAAPLVCAVTDTRGTFTFAGLPRNAETTLTLQRRGYLQLAFTTRTVHPLDYEQDYVATVPAYLAARAYASDPRHPFSAAATTRAGMGELALTAFRETRAKEAPLFGFGTPGMYAGNGAAGVRFRVFAKDGSGGFSGPVPEDGLIYAGTVEAELGRRLDLRGVLHAFASAGVLRRVLTRVEVPAPALRETSGLGLAILKTMPSGVYEAEAVHDTLDCLPTRDAWPGSTPRRARFEIVERTLGDVRFFCRERP